MARDSRLRSLVFRARAHGLLWVVGAIALIAGIEMLSVRIVADPHDRNNFFEYRYGRDEAPERVLVEEKIDVLAGSNPTILQVGDSSGFHGVVPPIVESILPGARYANMSVFANLGYRGYLEMARAVLRRSQNVKVLVLYVTPAGFQPNNATVGATDLLGEDIWREFASPLHALFKLPSLALRPAVTSLAFEGRIRMRDERDARALQRYPEARRLIPQTGGWTREHDTLDDRAPGARAMLRAIGSLPSSMPDAEVMSRVTAGYGSVPKVFDITRLRKISLAEQVFDSFRSLAERHGARLVIASAPMSDAFAEGPTGERLAQFQAELEAYKAKHPDVGLVPMVFSPDARFSSPVHVATPYTRANAVRFALALKVAIGPQDVTAPPSAARPTVETLEAPEIAGYGLSPMIREGASAYRTLRAGRSEALIFAQVRPDARTVHLDLAADTPEDLARDLTLSVFDDAASRMSDAPAPAAGERRLIWRLPDSSQGFNGWLELLVSTRGAREWRGDTLDPESRGSMVKILRLRFSPD